MARPSTPHNRVRPGRPCGRRWGDCGIFTSPRRTPHRRPGHRLHRLARADVSTARASRTHRPLPEPVGRIATCTRSRRPCRQGTRTEAAWASLRRPRIADGPLTGQRTSSVARPHTCRRRTDTGPWHQAADRLAGRTGNRSWRLQRDRGGPCTVATPAVRACRQRKRYRQVVLVGGAYLG